MILANNKTNKTKNKTKTQKKPPEKTKNTPPQNFFIKP